MKKTNDIKIVLLIQLVLLIIEAILFFVLRIIPDTSSYGAGALFSWEMWLYIIIVIIMWSIAIEFVGAFIVLIIFIIKHLIHKDKE
jgi:hypothetical protein